MLALVNPLRSRPSSIDLLPSRRYDNFRRIEDMLRGLTGATTGARPGLVPTPSSGGPLPLSIGT